MAGLDSFVASQSPVNNGGELGSALYSRELLVDRLALLLDQKPLHIIEVARGENRNVLDG